MAWKAGLLSDTYSMAAVDAIHAVRYRLHQRLVLTGPVVCRSDSDRSSARPPEPTPRPGARPE